jgi:hypothetical protein
MEQTKVTNDNRIDYFLSVYRVQQFQKNELFDLSLYQHKKVVAIDSCGWYYQQLFFELTKIEHVQTVKEYQLDQKKFDRLFNKIENIKETGDVLLLDHCPEIFKYKTDIELKDILNVLTNNIQPEQCLIRMDCVTLGDNRLTDRFKNLCRIVPESYVVEYFNYSVASTLTMQLRKKKYATNIN